MGSENLFHKKSKSNDLKRKVATRERQSHILIVCEDSKSGAFYFEAMANDLHVNASVEGDKCGSAPKSVLVYAKEKYEQSKKEGDAYDAVYCVFDRDQHPCFNATVAAINDLKTNKKLFFAITTTPCFEFWLLLHFGYTAKSYAATTQKSPCDCANADLQTYWKKAFGVEYGKNKRDIYPSLKGGKATAAIQHAKRLTDENLKIDSNNPQTNMHELVECLQTLSQNRQ